MTIVLTVALTALLLLLAWVLGQLQVFGYRLIAMFAASSLGYGAMWLADSRQVSDVVQAGLSIALALGAVAGALFLLQPMTWGIDDWLAQRDAEDVQP